MDATKFSKINRDGITFYTNKNKGNNVLKHVVEQCSSNEFPIARGRIYINKKTGDKKYYSEYACVNIEEFKKLLETDHEIYEVMQRDKKQKVAFDIDLKGTADDDPLEKVKEIIFVFFPNADLNISGSMAYLADKRTKKFSYHIILNNYFTNCTDDLAAVKAFCTLPEHKALGFDPNVYKSDGLLKCINQSKGDGRVQKLISGSNDLLDHCVMHNIPDTATNVLNLNLPGSGLKRKRNLKDSGKEKKKLKLEDVVDIPRMNLDPPEDFDLYTSDPETLLNAIPCFPRGHKFQLSRWACCKVAGWCKTVGITFDVFWKWCKQKENSVERLTKYREYWNYRDVEKMPSKENTAKSILLMVYNNKILRTLPSRRFYKSHNKVFHDQVDSRWLKAGDIRRADAHKNIVLHVPLGGNKSGAVMDWLEDRIEKYPKMTVLWITSRISLAHEQFGRMARTKAPWRSYLKMTPEEKKVYQKYFICSIQSLLLVRKSYDVIIIDECETMFRQFSEDATCISEVEGVWELLKTLVQLSKKNIWMDGILTNITTDFIRDVSEGEEPFIIGSKVPPPERVITFCEDLPDIYVKIREAVDAGKKIFIATGEKGDKVNSVVPRGVEHIVSHLLSRYPEWERGREIIGYHADRKQDKANLEHVNIVWGSDQLRVVIGNAALAVGVNFDPPASQKFTPFDCVFGLINSSFISFRDFFQLLSRVRHPLSNEIIVLATPPTIKAITKIDRVFPKCPVFDKLYNSMRLETIANNHTGSFKSIFADFCNLMNIKIRDGSKFKASQEQEDLLGRWINPEFNMYYWDNIATITDKRFEYYQERMDTYQANMDEIMAVRKYKFIKLFRKDVEEKIISDFWNDTRDTVYAVRKLVQLRNEQKVDEGDSAAATVILQYYIDNNIDFTQDHEILNEHIITTPLSEIKKAFRFYHTPTTYRMDLKAKIFNAYFAAKIVDKNYNKSSKGVRYTWDSNTDIIGSIAENLYGGFQLERDSDDEE